MDRAPAVAYYRKSTDRQEASIPAQRTEVQAYASKHSYHIIREYVDEGISGDDTEKRKDFQRMLRDATECRDFRAVLCWDQDRFGRFDPLEAGYWIKPLRDVGVYLETVAQGRIDWEDFAGRIIYAVQQEGKHAFLRDLSRNSIRGMLAKAKQGKWMGGPPPFGYRIMDQQLAPGDPEHVALVRWIFKTYVSSSGGVTGISKRLNERGTPAPRGGLWHHGVLRAILRCRAYVGDLVWNRLNEGKYHGIEAGAIVAKQRRSARWGRNDEQSWIVVPNAHEPLIGRETWERAQDKLQQARTVYTPHADGGDFLLAGLVHCGHCGQRMTGFHLRRSTIPVPVPKYICSRYNHCGRGACGPYKVRQETLVQVVLKKIENNFLEPTKQMELRAEMERQLSEDDTGAERRHVEAQLTNLDRKIDQGAERILEEGNPGLVQLLRKKVVALQEERDALHEQLGKINASAEGKRAMKTKTDKALSFLRGLSARLEKIDKANLRELLHEMVSRVECRFKLEPFGEKGRVTSRLTHGKIYVRPEVLVVIPGASGGPINNATGDTK